MGVSEHTGQDMLMGRDILHFRNFLKKELKEETREGEEPTLPASAETEVRMVVTCARQRQQNALEEEER